MPCEAAGAEATFVPDTAYGVAVTGIGSCFVDGVFKLGAPCPLEVTSWAGTYGGGIYGPDGTDSGGWTPTLELRSDVDSEVRVVTNLPIGDGALCTTEMLIEG